MIAGFARCDRDADALQFFQEMWDYSGFEPDDATLAAVLPVFARSGVKYIAMPKVKDC